MPIFRLLFDISVGLIRTTDDLTLKTTAEEYYQQAFAIARKNNNIREIGSLMLSKAAMLRIFKEFFLAEACILESIALFDRIGDQKSEAFAISEHGAIAIELAQFDKAIALLNNAYQMQFKFNDKNGMTMNLYRLGIAYARKGDKQQAKLFLTQAFEIATKHVKSLIQIIDSALKRLD